MFIRRERIMRLRNLAAALLLCTFFAGPSFAGPATNALGGCFTDFLNGKERKELGKWIFFAMSAHPEIADYSTVTAQNRQDTNQYIGELVMRLLTEDCAEETKAALADDGTVALKSAFELVGRVAMQELMTDSNVNSALADFDKYLDKAKLESLQAAN